MRRLAVLAICLFLIILNTLIVLADDEDCDVWEQTFDFSTGSHGWQIGTTAYGDAMGTYSAGGFAGIPYRSTAVSYSKGVEISYTLPQGSTITSITMVFDRTSGTTLSNAWWAFFHGPARTVIASQSGSGSSGENLERSWTGNRVFLTGEEVIVSLRSCNYTSACSNGDVLLKSVTITGTGTNPFTGEPPICITPVASFLTTPDSGTVPLVVMFTNQSQHATSYHWDFGDGNTSTGTNVVHHYTVPGMYIVTLTASNTGASDTATRTISVLPDASYVAAVSYKPLRSGDEDPEWGIFDFERNCELDASYVVGAIDVPCEVGDYDPFVNAFATGQSKDVHAVGTGTVVSVVGPGAVACDSIINGLGNVNYDCHVIVPNGVLNANGQDGWHVYRVDANAMYRVTVTYANEVTLDYFVSSPNVSVGDQVTAGCIIGKTLSLYPLFGVDLNYFISYLILGNLGGTDGAITSASSVNKSWTGLRAVFPEPSERLYPKLVLQPDKLTPCNQDPAYAECAGDPQLLNPTEWTTSGGVIWNPGAKPILPPFAQLGDTFYLSDNTTYSLTVQARTTGPGTGSLVLQLGNTQQTFPVTDQLAPLQIPAGNHVADSGFFRTASAYNNGPVGIELYSFCLAEGTVYSQPGSCYFLNPSFDDNLTHWSYNSGVSSWVTTGQVLMNDGGTIAQSPPSPLYPNGASEWEYYVTLKAAVIGDGWESASSSTVGFSWEFPSGGATGDFLSPASTTTYAFSSFKVNVPNNLNTFAGNEILFQANLPIASVTQGAFTLTANLDLNDDFEGAVLLRELCVHDPLAHWPDDGIGGGIDPPFTPTCTRVSPPTTNDVGAWTFFHWSSLDRFFQCDLMVTLNQIASTTNTTLHYVRWQGLYQQSVMQSYIDWIPSNVIPWLNGHFRNMSVGSVTVINQDSGGCHDIFCLAESFFSGTFGLLGPIVDLVVGLITQGANLLFGVITALVTIFIALVGQVWTLFSSLGAWLGALVNAWNSAVPVVPDFLPSCAVDYTSSAFCLAIFAMENTIFSGPGALLVPLIIGFGSIMLLLWAVGALRDVIASIGKNV